MIAEETCGLVVRQKAHNWKDVVSYPRNHFSFTKLGKDRLCYVGLILLFWIKAWKQPYHMCCNPENGRLDFWDDFKIYLHQSYTWWWARWPKLMSEWIFHFSTIMGVEWWTSSTYLLIFRCKKQNLLKPLERKKLYQKH